MIKNILDQSDLEGKTVLFRAELNVPIINGQVENDFRIRACLKTLNYLVEQKAKIVMISHIGRTAEDTFEPVYQYLKEGGLDISFKKDFFKSEKLKDDIEGLKKEQDDFQNGQIVLLDSLRHSEKETENDSDFAAKVAELGDIFVNDAFGVCHREHASIVGIAKNFDPENVFGGEVLCQEYSNLEKSFSPEKPAIFILGGNKFETKIPLIESFLNDYDRIILGGALANNFFRAKGSEIGQSVVDDIDYDFVELMKNPKVFVPEWVIAENPEGKRTEKQVSDVNADEKILDISPKSFEGEIENEIKEAKFILWNGPMGYYEADYTDGTMSLVKMISNSEGVSIAGGGNTVSAIEVLKKQDDFDFISTAGGAMMDFLTNRTLPGLEALGYERD